MAPRILLGIDLGTSVLKVCAFDVETTELLAWASRRLKVYTFPQGGREQSLKAIDRAFSGAIHEVREHIGHAWQGLVGIGVAAQGGSCIIANRTTGKPLTPMILWNDSRGQYHAFHKMADYPPELWRKRVLYSSPPTGLARILWLKSLHPELFCDENIHIGAGEYLFFKLTHSWRQDPGHAIQVGSYNAVKQHLDSALLDLVDVPLSFFAPLRQGHETAPLSKKGAALLDAPEGIPVAGPYMDQEAGYLSAVGISEWPIHFSLGTAWVGNFSLLENISGGSTFQLVLPALIGQGRFIIQPLLTGNPTLEWGLNTLINTSRSKAFAEADRILKESLLPEDGLIALPWFNQPGAFHPEFYGSGVFFGLSDQTDRADQFRALVVSLAFEMARVFSNLKNSGIIDSIVLGGGASKGAFFQKLFAALFKPLPVHCQMNEDLSAARGALFSLNKQVARAKTQQISIPSRTLLRKIRRHNDLYLELFNILYGHVPGGRPFKIYHWGKHK